MDAHSLPLVFMGLMGIAMLAYVVLDGFDLGIGILLPRAEAAERDRMIAAIGPFWDANETWLVLGVGILLTAFPMAHGIVMGELYLPVAAMLLGLVLRGVAFDFRAKAGDAHKARWDRAFFAGSLLAAAAQGWMLGLYIVGFERNAATLAFAAFIAAALPAGYALLGAGWLLMKTEGALQLKAVRWGLAALGLTALGVLAVSVATPWVSERIFDKWFTLPWMVLLAPIPLATLAAFLIVWRSLARLPVRLAQGNEYGNWVPFAGTVAVFVLAFYGLAYSIFPYVVVDRMDIWQAASAPESLMVILIGACITLPMIIGYSLFTYRVFRGKATALHYG
jgi:cytochrome d ubiquinol oxidase subunit II